MFMLERPPLRDVVWNLGVQARWTETAQSGTTWCRRMPAALTAPPPPHPPAPPASPRPGWRCRPRGSGPKSAHLPALIAAHRRPAPGHRLPASSVLTCVIVLNDISAHSL